MPKTKAKTTKLSTKSPEYLGKYAKQMWRAIVPVLNKNKEINAADEYLVARYCVAYDTLRNAYESVKEEGQLRPKFKTTLNPVNGEVVARDFTGYAKNPAVQNMKDAINQLNSMGDKLGLSPKSRNELVNLKKPDQKKKKEVPLDQALKTFFNK